ncbi:hypothetical protein JCGZ_05143 [Jatropha curcas]|uniref:Aminotransferase-like plant mobile domain-containing protein n=1 Tax=Jatropha curcas TaxID=180498 RepID=A0A067KTH9_JATCU|nr:hypothetical protein JCGZ_05143 [Jatropha curcas]
MSQLPEIPSSAYTPEMNALGAIPDIPTFEGEPVPVSQNPLTSGTRPLQLLPLPSTGFPLRHAGRSCMTQLFLREKLRDAAILSEQLRDATVPIDLGKAGAGGSSTDASTFWDLMDPPMRARVVAAGFGDYAAGLRRTQPRFPPAMRNALMERWNDCTHTFVFGFGEMTLTSADYVAIMGLRFDGPIAPLDARYQTATLGAQLVRSLLGVTTQTRYTAQGCVSYEVIYRFWAERIRTRLVAWRELSVEARPASPAYTREERGLSARSFPFYIISSQLLCTSQNKGDPAVLVCLRDLSRVGSFNWATLALAHLYHGLDVWTRSSGESNWQFIRPLEVWAYEYRIYPGGPSGDTPADSRQIPRYLAHCHHTFASTKDPHYWRCFLNDRALSDLLLTPWEGEAWRTYPARAVAELYTRSRLLLQGYWVDRYSLGERVYDTQVAPAQRRVPHAPPRHMCLLEGMTAEDREEEYKGSVADSFLSADDYATYFSTRLKKHRTVAHYRAEAEAEAAAAAASAGPAGAVLGDVLFPPGMEVVLDPSLGLGSTIIIPADLRQAPPPLQLDPEHATQVPAQRYQELCQRFGFARSFITRVYSERHERDLEIGRLRRHQSRQSGAVARLQMEVDRLRTRLEVEGIPLDFSEEDDDGSSSDDSPPSPPPQAAAGPSRRRQ